MTKSKLLVAIGSLSLFFVLTVIGLAKRRKNCLLSSYQVKNSERGTREEELRKVLTKKMELDRDVSQILLQFIYHEDKQWETAPLDKVYTLIQNVRINDLSVSSCGIIALLTNDNHVTFFCHQGGNLHEFNHECQGKKFYKIAFQGDDLVLVGMDCISLLKDVRKDRNDILAYNEEALYTCDVSHLGGIHFSHVSETSIFAGFFNQVQGHSGLENSSYHSFIWLKRMPNNQLWKQDTFTIPTEKSGAIHAVHLDDCYSKDSKILMQNQQMTWYGYNIKKNEIFFKFDPVGIFSHVNQAFRQLLYLKPGGHLCARSILDGKKLYSQQLLGEDWQTNNCEQSYRLRQDRFFFVFDTQSKKKTKNLTIWELGEDKIKKYQTLAFTSNIIDVEMSPSGKRLFVLTKGGKRSNKLKVKVFLFKNPLEKSLQDGDKLQRIGEKKLPKLDIPPGTNMIVLPENNEIVLWKKGVKNTAFLTWLSRSKLSNKSGRLPT